MILFSLVLCLGSSPLVEEIVLKRGHVNHVDPSEEDHEEL